MAEKVIERQGTLLGVYEGTPVNMVDYYYLNKFKQKRAVATTDIRLDTLQSELADLEIIPRGTQLPSIKVKGYNSTVISPDIIGGKFDLTPADFDLLLSGNSSMWVNGQPIDSKEYLKNIYIEKLKKSYMNTQLKMASSIYLTGKFEMPISGDSVDLQFEAPTAKTVKKADLDWATLINDLVEEYQEINGIDPTTIEVDKNIFKMMLLDPIFRDQVKAFGLGNSVSLNSNENAKMQLSLLGYTIKQLPKATGVDGKVIDTTNLIYLSNDNEFVKVFSCLYTTNTSGMVKFIGELVLTHSIFDDPVGESYKLESGFVPIIPIKNRIMRWKLTVNE